MESVTGGEGCDAWSALFGSMVVIGFRRGGDDDSSDRQSAQALHMKASARKDRRWDLTRSRRRFFRAASPTV